VPDGMVISAIYSLQLMNK